MTITQIHTNVEQLVQNYQKDSFIYDLMLAYGLPKSIVSRLKNGSLNMSKNAGEILLKKKFLYKELNTDELQSVMDALTKQDKIKHEPRFVILTDYKNILAYDTKTEDSLETTIKDLTKNYAFFLPLAGMEKAQYQDENPADVKAAEKMAKLFDEIKKHNPTKDETQVHDLNVFLTRLLFCFFAEDTGIFDDNQFTNAIDSHTQEDGSDLGDYLTQLFEVLNLENRPANLPKHLADFPYVNGGLFENVHPVPTFSKKARRYIIESGKLDWAEINPDIFGSMIQAVVTAEHRGSMGMHYTSVPNIMKVIEPLFLNELQETFRHEIGKVKVGDRINGLNDLLKRLQNIKIFDPACGSGNFLIIAYKELRKLEMKILKAKGALEGTFGSGTLGFGNEFKSVISLSQFYGIELDDFAHEVASLSLWLAEHQMNTAFKKEFGSTKPALPLREGGHIVHGNACRLDWEEVCPKEEGKEVFILGNPPYLGASMQSKEQKKDKEIILFSIKGFRNLDYIACWFIKGSNYIKGFNSSYSFVTTNSINQGEQVELIWKSIFKKRLEIFFAYESFKWENNARNKAGVTVVIIGVRNIQKTPKYIYSEWNRNRVNNINAYLTNGNNHIITKRKLPLSEIPKMDYGSKAVDGGHLILSELEKNDFIANTINGEKFIKKFIGSNEFIKGINRYCLWIDKENYEAATKNLFIKNRIEGVKEMRQKSSKNATKKLASSPHSFGEIRYKPSDSVIIVPSVSSEHRLYFPIGFLDGKTIISNLAFAIYNGEPFIFSLLTSRMHIVWIKAVAGRLETRIRYSNTICYNTFPFPKITDTQKKELETHVYAVLEQRELHPEKTLAQLYDPDKMPEGLLAAHQALDLAVERCYRKEPFTSDEERLAYLFKLYEKMIAEEKERDTLFAKEKKTRKRKK